MDYLLVLNGESAAGLNFLQLTRQIGGASGIWKCGAINHPALVCTNLDWSTPGFVKLVHLRNPTAPDKMGRELVVRAEDVVLVQELDLTAPANQQPAAQNEPPSSLH